MEDMNIDELGKRLLELEQGENKIRETLFRIERLLNITGEVAKANAKNINSLVNRCQEHEVLFSKLMEIIDMIQKKMPRT
jgi:hypothetical protein